MKLKAGSWGKPWPFQNFEKTRECVDLEKDNIRYLFDQEERHPNSISQILYDFLTPIAIVILILAGVLASFL